MIIVYLFILLIFGFFVESILEKIKWIDASKISNLERISFSSLLGFLCFSWYVLIIGMLNIKLSFSLFYLIILCDILYVVHFLFKKKNIRIKINIKKKMDYKFLLLLISFIILFTYFISYAYFHNILYPDEFAAWALNSKRIFFEQKLNLFLNTGIEKYPDFLPIVYSSFYIFSGKIVENAIRIIPGIIFLFFIINLLGLLQKHKINKTKFLFFIILIMLTYNSFVDFTFSTYADLPFAAFYTLGILYLFEWILYDDCKTNMFLSILYMNAACWTKIDGLPMVVFNFGILILYYIIKKFTNLKLKTNINWKKCLVYIFGIVFVGIVWKLYSNTFNSVLNTSSDGGSGIVFNIQWLNPLLVNMWNQQFCDWTWAILISTFIISLFLNWNYFDDTKRIYIIFGVLSILFTILFLIICYLVQFGAEAIIAPSYLRYMTRVLFIMLFITLFSLEKGKIKN